MARTIIIYKFLKYNEIKSMNFSWGKNTHFVLSKCTAGGGGLKEERYNEVKIIG